MHRNMLHQKYLKSKSQINFQSYRTFRNHVTSMLRKAKMFHLSNLVNNNATCSTIWSALKILMNNGNSHRIDTSMMPSASDLNNHFIQVCKNSLASATPPPCTLSQLASSATISDLVIPFVSSHQCESLIQRLKPKRSTGCDTVSPIVLKAAPEHLSLPLSCVNNSAIS